MKQPRHSTEQIELLTNEDEAIQSADMLIHGKNVLF